MPALRALEQSEHDVRRGVVGVHGAQLHRHCGFVPVTSWGIFVGHTYQNYSGRPNVPSERHTRLNLGCLSSNHTLS